MKKTLASAILILFFITRDTGAYALQKTLLHSNDHVATIMITAVNCAVDVGISNDDSIVYTSSGEIYYDSMRKDDALLIYLFAPYDSADKAPVRITLPCNGGFFLELQLDHASAHISPEPAMSLRICAKNGSRIKIPLLNIGERNIELSLEGESRALFTMEQTACNFRIDCTLNDDRCSVSIGNMHSGFCEKGVFHYQKGTANANIAVTLDTGSSFFLGLVKLLHSETQ